MSFEGICRQEQNMLLKNIRVCYTNWKSTALPSRLTLIFLLALCLPESYPTFGFIFLCGADFFFFLYLSCLEFITLVHLPSQPASAMLLSSAALLLRSSPPLALPRGSQFCLLPRILQPSNPFFFFFNLNIYISFRFTFFVTIFFLGP